MNILFLTPQLPFPPRQGTAIRNWGLISHLAARGHAITLLSFAEAGQAPHLPQLQAACHRVLTVPPPTRRHLARLLTLLSPAPDLARRRWSPLFARQLAGLLQANDCQVINVEGLEMAPYLFRPHGAGQISRPSSADDHLWIYDAHNAEHIIQRRACATDLRRPTRWPAALYSWTQIRRLERFEAAVCRAVHHVTCVSAEDAAALERLAGGIHPTIIPNGLDLADYSLPAAAHRPIADIIFTGKMDYRPNVDAVLWFAREIWPRIRAMRPAARCLIVGQKPAKSLLKLDGHGGMTITGEVPDTRPYIAGARVYVAPLRMGGGTRFKLLEAMALARPIVSTSVGAEGFEVRSGRELLLADTPADFAAAVIRLLEDEVLAEAVGQAGRAFVESGYDWSVIVPRLEQVYSDFFEKKKKT